MASIPLIAIVEDDLSLQRALSRLVRSYGYEARGFGSAEEFLRSDCLAGCACLVSDIQLPGQSGLDLGRLLRQCRPDLPVVMITARSDAGLEQAAIASGARFFLRKPVDQGMLADCIGRALQA